MYTTIAYEVVKLLPKYNFICVCLEIIKMHDPAAAEVCDEMKHHVMFRIKPAYTVESYLLTRGVRTDLLQTRIMLIKDIAKEMNHVQRRS